MLELRDLVKHYRVGGGEPIRAVDGVSMTAAAGEFVALYGPSGSGKTTLLELIAGLERPDSGAVLVDGRDIFALSARESDEYRLRVARDRRAAAQLDRRARARSRTLR